MHGGVKWDWVEWFKYFYIIIKQFFFGFFFLSRFVHATTPFQYSMDYLLEMAKLGSMA